MVLARERVRWIMWEMEIEETLLNVSEGDVDGSRPNFVVIASLLLVDIFVLSLNTPIDILQSWT